jgi:murein DD-endopeptidase MepM/ murein hydrolase activator NlpD
MRTRRMRSRRKILASLIAGSSAMLAIATSMAVGTRVADASGTNPDGAAVPTASPLPTPTPPPPPPPPTLPVATPPLPTLPVATPTLPPLPSPPSLPTSPPSPTPPTILPTPLPTLPPVPCVILCSSPTPKPTPLPTPPPLPCLILCPSPTPTLPALPSPPPILPTPPGGLLPTPTPGVTVNNDPGIIPNSPPSGVNGGGGGGSGSGGGTPPGVQNLGPAPAPIPQAAIAALAQTDPTLAGRVADIAGHPVAADPPGLRHFQPVDATQPDSGGLGGRIGDAVNNPSVMLALVAAVIAAVAAGVAMHRGWMPAWLAALRRRIEPVTKALRYQVPTRLGPIPVLVLLIPVASAGIAAPLAALDARNTAASIAPVHVDPSVLAIRSGSVQTTAPSTAAHNTATASTAWTGLVSIEKRIAADRYQLNALEASMSSLSGAAAAGGNQQQLRDTVAAHDKLASSYQSVLQEEYTFFRGAGANPASRDQLLAAAQVSPAAVRDAVLYDLRVIETQLTQEAAIHQAVAAAPVVATTMAPTHTLVAQGTPGRLSSPMWGSVAQGFGPTSFGMEAPMTYHGRFYPHFHTGIDISAPRGTAVQAAGDGVVLLATSSVDGAGNLVGYGRYVVIQHANNVITVYAHLDRISVMRGQQVSAGQLIGQEGSTGWSTGPHLHFEVHHNGDFVDPMAALVGRA